MTPRCSFAGCRDDGVRTRRAVSNGETYHYCPDHDPLASDHAHGFKAVDDDE